MSWASPLSGSWDTASNWSPAIIPRNNMPPGAHYDVYVGALGSHFNIAVPDDGMVELDSLSILSPNATLSSSFGAVRTGSLVLSAGTVNIGTLYDARLAVAPGAHLSVRSLHNAVVVEDLTLRPSPQGFAPALYNGVRLENAHLRVPGAYCDTPQTIDGTGTLSFYGSFGLASSSTLTIGEQVTVRIEGSSARAFTAPVVNRGTIELLSGNNIRFGHLSNEGRINMSGGTITFQSGELLQNPGQFNRTGGTLIYAGVHDLRGVTVDLATGPVGPVQLAQAWLTNGTLIAPGSIIEVRPRPDSNNPRNEVSLGSVAIAANMHVNQNATLGLGASPLVGTTISLAPRAYLASSNLVGQGTITFDDDANLSGIVSGGSFGSLTVGSGITIRATGTSNFVSAATLTNNGTILVDGANDGVAREFLLPALVNHGTVAVSNGGVLNMLPGAVNNGAILGSGGIIAYRGNLTPTSLDPFQATDPILAVAGTLTTSSSSLSVSNPNYRLGLYYNGRIRNLTLVGDPGDALFAAAPYFNIDSAGTLENVVAEAGIKVSNMNVYTTNLINRSHLELSGGRIVLEGEWANDGSITASAGATIVIERFKPTLGPISLNTSTLSVADAVVSPGTLSTSVLDTVVASNATISLDRGIWDNRNRTLTSSANSATIRMNGGTLLGGRLEASGGSVFAIGAATLDSVTLSGAGTIGPFQTSITGGRLTLDAATISLQRDVPSGVLRAIGETIIDGTGEFIAYHQNFPVAAIQAVNGTLTIGEGITFRTGNAAPFFTGTGTLSSVINRGQVYCDYPFQAGGTQLPRFENLGLLEVGPGATFSTSTTTVGNLNNRTLTGGRWWVRGSLEFGFSSSTISFDTNAAEVQLIGPASQFRATNSLLNNAGTFAILNGRNFTSVGSLGNSGTFFIGPSSTLKTSGALVNTGTVDVNGSVVVDYATADPSPRSVLEQQIATARNGGAWDQAGITSTAAKAAFPRNLTLGLLEGIEYRSLVGAAATFGGLTFDDSSILIKSTYYGDTDLNGIVDFDDYSRTDSGFNSNLTGWFHGDFDYNNIVDFDDYSLIDLAFNTQSGTILRALSYLDGHDRSGRGMDAPSLRLIEAHYAEFGDRYASSFLNAIPEPASAILMIGVPALAGMSCRLRRRASTARALA
ncbi:MAG: hypothetical protein H7Z14_09105 [Anaerolineae bacterium]|nr:hypothetical protein [Phycisphaerae bacterium]